MKKYINGCLVLVLVFIIACALIGFGVAIAHKVFSVVYGI